MIIRIHYNSPEIQFRKNGIKNETKTNINSIHKKPVLFNYRSISRDQPATVDDHPVSVEPFPFSPSETVAYEGS